MNEEIANAATLVKAGKVILYPTDTIWGLGCDPINDDAVSQIFTIKQREDSKALIVLIREIGDLYNFVDDIPEIAWDLVEFAEKPLTIVYPKGRNVSKKLLGEDGSIAIRLTKDPFCQKLIARSGKGIVSTSANISGDPNPVDFNSIHNSIKESVGYIVNYKRNEKVNLPPSTIIKLELNGEFKFIRK